MPAPLEVLQKYWGFHAFRPLQEDIIQAVLAGQDTLALLPTGGGKSICFQVPALCKEGICLVISPLIALMKDQVQNLQKHHIKAEAIYSGMHYRDIDRILDNCAYGKIKFLYISPERLQTELLQERLQRMQVNLLAVDEAHCVSQWGYDFRPPYLQIADIRPLLPGIPILALTATATPKVIEDIQEKLAFKDGHVFQKSFERPNLSYVVLASEGKEQQMLDILRKVPGSGIVYARNRRKTKELAYFLYQNGIAADYYHAGISTDLREKKQDAWVDNQTRIMVSTNAFGMGIDKPDVRTVVHMDLPDSLEAYFQEAGRAGRDGEKAYAVLLYNQNDRLRLEKNYELSFPPMEEIRRVYRALGSFFQLAVGGGTGVSFDFDLIEFSKTYQLEAFKVLTCLKILEQEEWLILTESVYVPSSLKILVSKDDLYDYLLRHPKMDKLLKTILRGYQGAFQHYIYLREKQLSGFLQVPLEQLQNSLQMLRQEHIIDYQPQKDKPQLIFSHERVDADNLSIDQQRFHFLKKRYLERITKAIAYAENPVCRSHQLLQYFGEQDPPRCGNCDVCLGRTQGEINNDDFARFKTKIERLLARERLSLEQLVESFSPKHRNQVLKAIEYLLDEGFIGQEGEKFFWNFNQKSK